MLFHIAPVFNSLCHASYEPEEKESETSNTCYTKIAECKAKSKLFMILAICKIVGIYFSIVS